MKAITALALFVAFGTGCAESKNTFYAESQDGKTHTINVRKVDQSGGRGTIFINSDKFSIFMDQNTIRRCNWKPDPMLLVCENATFKNIQTGDWVAFNGTFQAGYQPNNNGALVIKKMSGQIDILDKNIILTIKEND